MKAWNLVTHKDFPGYRISYFDDCLFGNPILMKYSTLILTLANPCRIMDYFSTKMSRHWLDFCLIITPEEMLTTLTSVGANISLIKMPLKSISFGAIEKSCDAMNCHAQSTAQQKQPSGLTWS
ncbi:hypothetical protein BC941DRAFT_472653 [Chlamydoabsidia padenii]|nr:hypothetical protein BC941DRAFT_472653 [Chlamydoabsidia padenii]